MAVKIVYLLLTLAVVYSCLDGRVGGHSELDPGFRLGIAAPSRDNPLPKIEPMALTRVQLRGPGFNPLVPGPKFHPRNLQLNRPNIRIRFGVGPSAYGPGNSHPRRQIPRHPDVIRRPNFTVPIVNVLARLHEDVIFVDPVGPGRLQSAPLHPEFRPWMNNGPLYHDQSPIRFHPGANSPVHWVPRHLGPVGIGRIPPMQPNHGRSDFNQVNNRSRDGDQKKDLPKGTVGVTVTAVNQTEQGSVHANVTVFVVPKRGDNKETLETAAQSIMDGIFIKNKDEKQKRKGADDLEDAIHRIDLQ